MTKYEVKADLHNHLRNWDDNLSNLDPRKVVSKIEKNLGRGAYVGIEGWDSNDTRVEQFFEAMKRAYGDKLSCHDNALYLPEKDIWFISGQEVFANDNGHTSHLVVLGIKPGMKLKYGKTIEDTLKEARGLGAISSLVHSFSLGGAGKVLTSDSEKEKRILSLADAMEVYNGQTALWLPGILPRKANKRAREYFESVKDDYPNLGGLINSDGHNVYEIGRSYTDLEMSQPIGTANAGELISELRRAINSNKSPKGRCTPSRTGTMINAAQIAIRDIILPKLHLRNK
jgi:hypothetical protein